MTIWANASALVRVQAEVGLTAVEQQRQLLHNNTITSTFMKEKDARAEEKENLDLQIADKTIKKISVEHSLKAADYDIWGAAFSLLKTVGNTVANLAGGFSASSLFNALPGLIDGIANLITKVMDKNKIEAEEDAVNEELGKLKLERCQMEKGVAALYANPYV